METGQAYRAKVFRNLGLEAKFVFATTFPSNNIWKEMEYLGFQESETMWLYGFFTDCRNSTELYTLEQLESTFDEKDYDSVREGAVVKYLFRGRNFYYVVHMLDEESNGIHRVEIVSNANMIRRDFYTYWSLNGWFQRLKRSWKMRG